MVRLSESLYKLVVNYEEYGHYQELEDRRLYLTFPLVSSEEMSDLGMIGVSFATEIVDNIIEYNREDTGIPPEERKPIRLYINSPGGSAVEGFSIVSAIEASKTPIYTINVGEWSSMAFLIGITGHQRFSLPYMTFLMHEGSTVAYGAANKAKDKIEFERRFELEVIKKHVLKHSMMKPTEYDALVRVEYYMLPEDALERGFIDKIVSSLDEIV